MREITLKEHETEYLKSLIEARSVLNDRLSQAFYLILGPEDATNNNKQLDVERGVISIPDEEIDNA